MPSAGAELSELCVAGGSELIELSGIVAGAESLGGLVAGIPQTAEQQVGLALRCSSFVSGVA